MRDKIQNQKTKGKKKWKSQDPCYKKHLYKKFHGEKNQKQVKSYFENKKSKHKPPFPF
jgi:hypothetical protein